MAASLDTPNRRKGDMRMQHVIDSPWFKVVAIVLQGVLALAVWAATTAISSFGNELRNMRTQLDTLTTSRAVSEDQLKSLQAYKQIDEASGIVLRERLSAVEADVRNLKDRKQ
jgi:hypothetical protein